jgi:hypothetical protein
MPKRDQGSSIPYLTFELFVDSWILARAKAEGIARRSIMIPMILTFMLRPIGLLLILLGFRKRPRKAQTA